MKHIIILGEEYWFEKLGTKFTEANTLLQYLERHKISKYEYTIIKSPAQIITTVNTIGMTNIKAIFLFQDILSDSNLNNRTIMEMKKFVTDLVNNDIFV